MTAVPLPAPARWSLIDIAVNLTDSMYTGMYNGRAVHAGDRDAVVERAHRCGVRGMLLTGGSAKESREVIDLCRAYNPPTDGALVNGPMRHQLLCTVGCHPTRCEEFVSDPDAYYDTLDALIAAHSVRDPAAGKHACVAAVGEVGLDYDRLFFCGKEVQQTYFRRQLALAEKHQLPLFLHDRNTGGDFAAIMAEHSGRFVGGVVHSFTGTVEELKQHLSLGLYIGINGCSLKTQENLEVVRHIPLDRLMIETDAPWCGVKNTHASRALLAERARRLGATACVTDSLLSAFPVVKRDKFYPGAVVKDRCEPCQLVSVLEVLHELHKDTPHPKEGSPLTLEALADIVTANTKRLFPFTIEG